MDRRFSFSTSGPGVAGRIERFSQPAFGLKDAPGNGSLSATEDSRGLGVIHPFVINQDNRLA
jgi:hypothetical protein